MNTFETAGYLLAFAGCVVGPGWVFLKDPRRESHRAFATLGLAGALFNGFHYLASRTPDPELKLSLLRQAFVGAFLLLPIVIRFPASLLGAELSPRRRALEIGAWLVAGAFAAVALSGGFLTRLDARGIGQGGVALGLWSLTIGAAFLRFAYVLNRAYKATDDQGLRNRILYLVLGAVLFAVPAFFDLVYRLGFDHRLPFPLASYGSLGFLACLGVAVVKHRLLDIEVVIHRGLVLSLLAPSLGGSFVVLGALTEQLTAGSLPPDSPYPEILAAILVACLFEPLSRFLSHLVETYVIAEFRSAPRLKDFRRLPWLIGAEAIDELKELHGELGGIIHRLEEKASGGKTGDARPRPLHGIKERGGKRRRRER